ncbi:FhaA domain-containing protein [Cumulibacter manganitolerans]|uniref:FhaA domain-containing protein n=1 Tax=Cumulibacter manganitolerans TaxID=1884992 RepID=UPI0012959534|nr:DUF3662 and FHA domain-containing protein [Cumulibacter manganitolerans]
MGVFSRLERKLEHGVGSAFARMFKGKVHPAEIARALQQDADDNATEVAKGRTLVPNRYTVRLGETDYAHLMEWEKQLTRSLADICREHFTNEGYSTYGAVKVSFARDDELRTGVFEIESGVDDAEPSVPLRHYQDELAARAPQARLRSTQHFPSVPPPAPRAAAGAVPPPAQRRAPARPAYRHLVVVDATRDRLPLRDGRNVIGRGSTADIRITDNGISREHAEIVTNGVLATLTDLNSTNGTMVNGNRVDRAALRHGDVIRVGRSVLVYRYEPEGPR